MSARRRPVAPLSFRIGSSADLLLDHESTYCLAEPLSRFSQLGRGLSALTEHLGVFRRHEAEPNPVGGGPHAPRGGVGAIAWAASVETAEVLAQAGSGGTRIHTAYRWLASIVAFEGRPL
jgi:hypothetical protein